MISGTFIFAYLALLALICGALGILMTNGFVIPAFLILLFLIGLVVLAVIIQFLFIKDIYDNKLSKLNAHTMMIDTLWQERST